MTERLSPLSGLICEVVNSVGQGNFTFFRKKSGKIQKISEISRCGSGSHVKDTPLRLINFVQF